MTCVISLSVGNEVQHFFIQPSDKRLYLLKRKIVHLMKFLKYKFHFHTIPARKILTNLVAKMICLFIDFIILFIHIARRAIMDKDIFT